MGPREIAASVNFGFLSTHDPRLAVLGAQAERYFREDPPTTIFKLRQLAELLAKLIAAHHAIYRDDREAFEETLRRLSYDRILPREAADDVAKIDGFGFSLRSLAQSVEQVPLELVRCHSGSTRLGCFFGDFRIFAVAAR